MSRARDLSKLTSPSNFTVDTNNNIGVNSITPDAKFDVIGIVSATKYFGDGSELTGITGGTTLAASSGTQRLVVTSLTSGIMSDVGTNLNLNYNTATNTLSTGNITGVAATFSGKVTLHNDLDMQDSDKIRIGTDDDLRIQHDGNNSLIDQLGTGHLYLRNYVDDKGLIVQADDGSGGVTNYIYCNGSNGAVNLYQYGNLKLNTKWNGVNVTGELKCDSLDVDGNVSIGGTLTYEDVTNIDSVGVITARSCIIATGIVTATEFDGQTELRSWLFG